MKVLIIIPAFNESNNIARLAREIEDLGYDYLIINDCSTDRTAEILDDEKLKHIDLPVNLGLAAVTQVGFKYAAEKEFDCAIVIDGDGQHPPQYIEKVISKIGEGYDYVIGSRFLEKDKMWNMRMVGSRLISFVIKIKTGKTFTDPTSGMRATGKKTLSEFATGMNFIAEPDALTYLLKRKLKICEVQVDMVDRDGGESYFSNPIKSIKFMFNVVMSILFIQW